jgi:hypothetical protein
MVMDLISKYLSRSDIKIIRFGWETQNPKEIQKITSPNPKNMQKTMKSKILFFLEFLNSKFS